VRIGQRQCGLGLLGVQGASRAVSSAGQPLKGFTPLLADASFFLQGARRGASARQPTWRQRAGGARAEGGEQLPQT